MRQTIIILISLIFGLACNTPQASQQQPNKTQQQPTATGSAAGCISFKEDFHDFGTLQQNEIVSYTFRFTNTGKSSLLVRSVRASCGCTSSGYTKEPIAPGQEGEVSIQFDSSGFRGMQNKSATVITNGQPSDFTLHFSAIVE